MHIRFHLHKLHILRIFVEITYHGNINVCWLLPYKWYSTNYCWCNTSSWWSVLQSHLIATLMCLSGNCCLWLAYDYVCMAFPIVSYRGLLQTPSAGCTIAISGQSCAWQDVMGNELRDMPRPLKCRGTPLRTGRPLSRGLAETPTRRSNFMGLSEHRAFGT